ncbi:hypothetical protein E0I61_08690 [Flavobacterium ranwuense]|uniref:Uncharacterized protein n=1 Tax=Flavobacterium ranwuense TaxID=2541725 RepID=A0ABY2DR45_9FLAO|nr:hypothetical protein [Flavobacterium ranwuense]TDE29234.1 hypothetical protein E0I61_08690 [Flavobacterium ranwuense]
MKLKLLFIMSAFCVFYNTINAQSNQTEPKYIQNWTQLEEAKFYFDVSYAVVKCSPTSKAKVIMNAFNEGGTYPKVGFKLALKDAAGNEAQMEIALFETKIGDMFIASCDSEDHANLRFDVPEGIDASTMKISIIYNTGS